MEVRRSEPPTLLDVAPLSESAHLAILNGDVDLFILKRKELSELKRQFSWEITSEEQLMELCVKFGFKGVAESPEANAKHLWAHEQAHKNEAEKHGVSAVVRLAELDEPHHSRYTIYTDINLDDLVKVTKGKTKNVLKILGEITMAPEKVGLGYKAETLQAKIYLKSAKFFKLMGPIKF